MIGIIFAMKEELDSFLKDLKINNKKKIYELVFYEIKYNDLDLVLVQSGIGKVNAARTTQVLIDFYKIDFLFNIGVAGAVSNKLDVLDIVIGSSLIQHDFDITSFNHEKGYIPNIGTFMMSDSYLIEISKSIPNYKLFTGVIASGDIFLTDINMSSKINNKFKALCVEMEGASIAQVATLCKIPFVVIRCISDTIDSKREMEYQEFLSKSSYMISNYLKEILKKMSKKSFKN